MRIEPLPYYRPPRYPTRTLVEAHPELLRLVPKRWRSHPGVLAALGAACVTLEGCAQTHTMGTPAPPNLSASLVAPVFRHGDGRASFGCEVVSPPVYMTEDEARATIAEAAKAAGIRFEKEQNGKADPTRVAGVDKARHIHFEYITAARDEQLSLSHPDSRNYSSVSTVDTAKAAENVRKKLADSHPGGAHAVFYQTMAHRSAPDWQHRESASPQTKAQLRAELKAQVQDFIKWLQAQGVI